MKRRIAALLLALALAACVLPFSACQPNNGGDGDGTEAPAETKAPKQDTDAPEATQPAAELPTEELPTEAPENTEEPATEEPQQTEAPKTEEPAAFSFTNSLPVMIRALYVSPSRESSWGQPAVRNIAPGQTVQLTFAQIGAEPGEELDFGPVDENDYNYDCYNIPVADEDSIILWGDETGANYRLLPANGEMNEYEAEVYLTNGSGTDAPEFLTVDITRSSGSDYYSEGSGDLMIEHSWEELSVPDECLAYYPQIGSSLALINRERRTAVENAAMARLNAFRSAFDSAPEDFRPGIVQEKGYLRRADRVALSILYQTYIGEPSQVLTTYAGETIDTATGGRLTLADISNDPALWPAALNAELTAQGYEPLFNESGDYSAYFYANCSEIAWTLDPNGVNVILNPYAFGSGMEDEISLFFPFARYPELVKAAYREAPANYAIAFPAGLLTQVDTDGDGRADPAYVMAELGDYSDYSAVYAGFGSLDEDDMARVEFETDIVEPIFIHYLGRNYLYVRIGIYYYEILVFDLNGRGPQFVNWVSGNLMNSMEEGGSPDGQAPSYRWRQITDPNAFILQCDTSLLGADYGVRTYHPGEQGIPVSDFRMMDLVYRHELRTKIAVTGELYDEAGDPLGGEFTIPAGQKVTCIRTDDERYVDLMTQDGQIVRITLIWDDNVGAWCVDGVKDEDAFSGIRYFAF